MSSHAAVNGAENAANKTFRLSGKSFVFEHSLPETPSTSSSSRPTFMSRRSFAHQPRLLGFENVDLLELPTHSTTSAASTTSAVAATSLAPPPPPPPSRASRPRVKKDDIAADGDVDDRFKIDDEEGGTVIDSNRIANGVMQEQTGGNTNQSIDSSDTKRRAPIRDESYASIDGNDLQEEQECAAETGLNHRQIGNGYAEIDRGDRFDDDGGEDVEEDTRSNLIFEATTVREKTWMWTSAVLVAILTTVSISIAVGWIDWPGDGLGRN